MKNKKIKIINIETKEGLKILDEHLEKVQERYNERYWNKVKEEHRKHWDEIKKENPDQMRLSVEFEKRPKPHLLALKELMEKGIEFRYKDE